MGIDKHNRVVCSVCKNCFEDGDLVIYQIEATARGIYGQDNLASADRSLLIPYIRAGTAVPLDWFHKQCLQ